MAIMVLALFSVADARSSWEESLARHYFITASAGDGGSIDPSGWVVVKRDKDQTFEISADYGYEISDVLVDGESVGAVEKFKFAKVKNNHTIEASFAPRTYTITPTASAGGGIEPSRPVIVKHGADQEFTIDADPGYEIEDVLVDHTSVGPLNSYLFEDIQADHSIRATFFSFFRVLDVSIPNESMMIGAEVTVTMTMQDDQGNPYTLISGSVGGYPLEGFHRISATSYESSFIISQGGNSYTAKEDVPVSNLVISNGEVLSTPYNLPIVQDSDPLDAELPLISSMLVGGGDLKIGDVLNLVIEADGLNYRIDPRSSINGIAVTESNIDFSESGSGTYMLAYTIQEGDRDVGPGSSELQASVILIKPSGNTGLPFSTVSYTSSLTIDAHAPVVSRLEVPNITVGVGGLVIVTISADETGYTGGDETMINGVSLSSSRVNITELSDGQYELSYIVAIEDLAVAPGQLDVSVSMVDSAGNVGSVYFTLEPNSLEIYTDLPEAGLEGATEICEGEEAELTVSLTGQPPFNIELNAGDTVLSFTNIITTEYDITVNPVQSTTYKILLVTDVNGVENTGSGEFRVTVNETTHVEIINLATGYNVEADSVLLEANVPGGTFSGRGVNNETGYFHPDVADTIHSPHTITYSYENDNGCTSVDRKLVYVVGAQGAILLPDSPICANDESFIATVFKPFGETGSFSLLDSSSQPVTGLVDHGDNTASIDPGLLSVGEYTVVFKYYDGATLYLRKSFSIEAVDQPQILPLDETVFCQDADPIILLSNLSYAVFEGKGVSGNIEQGFIFAPRDSKPGMQLITCTAIAQNGCSASTVDSVEVLFSPEIQFEMTTECLPDGGEIVSFHNLTNEPQLVETWNWDFGDPGSGEENQSMLKDPEHHYLEPGQRIISLSASTFEACEATYQMDTIIDSRPEADFTWISDCFSSESAIEFVNLTRHGSALPDTIIWTFKNSEGDVLGQVGTKEASDTVAFSFEMANSYQVDLYTMNMGGCTDEISKEILLRPSIQPDRTSYQESFNETHGMWSVHSDNQLESWVWGEPDFTGFTPVAGDNAWFTFLPSGSGGYEENSWIESPCFDFTGFKKPMIQMDIMQSFYPYFSGAVLQYRDVIGEGWKTIGENTQGINWYSFDNIANKPGGSSIGWGSEAFSPDTEWVSAVHDLDQLVGKKNVALRIAFASIGKMNKGNQGFAVNNLLVTERSKIAVVEHFTNYSNTSSRLADDIIDELGSNHRSELINLQYHTNHPEMDPMNINNPHPSETRSPIYGVQQAPYTVLSGGYQYYDFSGLQESPVEDHLSLLTLEIPAFDVELTIDWQNYSLEANTTVTCLSDRFDDYIQLYLVVFETTVSSYTGPNGDTEFRNVVLDMLPTPAGELLEDNWRKGNSNTHTYTWDYKSYVEDINELAVAAFIQDRTTGRILQAAVDYKDETVGILKPASGRQTLNIYPNPTQSTLHLNLDEETKNLGRVELSDINGRLVLSETLQPGSLEVQLHINHLERGIYILQWIESGQIRGVSKVVKTR